MKPRGPRGSSPGPQSRRSTTSTRPRPTGRSRLTITPPSQRSAHQDERPRGARPARPRADRARPRQDADPRDRGAAPDRPPPVRGRARLRAAVAAHVLHGQPGHGQDDGRDEDGAGALPPRLHRGAARRRLHPRRPRRPVRRPHGAEDEGGAPPRLRRRPLHRRGLLPLQARERARLRRRGDRDPAPGDGGRAGQAGRDLRRLQGPDGRLLPLEPGLSLARRASHRLPRLRRRRADGDRAPDARAPELRLRPRCRGRVPRLPRAARPAAAVRARPQRPQLDRPRPPAAGEPPVRRAAASSRATS